MLTRLRSLLRALFRRDAFDAGVTEEMQLHIELYTADLVRSGVHPAEAARRARIEFGNVHTVRLDCREARGVRPFDGIARNVRYSFRTLRKTPGFTASIVATLALCLGSTLTIFAVVDSILLRPLPFPDAGRLMSVYNTYPKAGVPNDGCSLTNYYERRGQVAAFAGVAAYREGVAIVGQPGATEREDVMRVTPDFFSTLGLGPVMGRAFTEEETVYRNSGVAILSDGYWRQRLNGDPDAIGRRIRVDGSERIVVGVLPAAFSFLSSKARIYLPLASNPAERAVAERHSGNSDMIARLGSGVSVAEAQSQIDAHNAALEADNPEAPAMADAGFRSLVVPLHADHVAAVRGILVLLQAAALVLLLIGAVNVTNLLLIRASGRVKELAVRQAIGASRRHVVMEVMAETILVAVAGGMLGLVVGVWGIGLLRTLGAELLPLGVRVGFDARLALVGLAGAVALGIAIAAPIAWYHLRIQSSSALQSEFRGGTPTRVVQRVRHGFVVAQIALAFVLLAGAGLLAVSLKQVMAVSPGFRPDNILTGQMTLPGKNYPDDAALVAFAERLMTGLDRQPGVLASGIATNVPLSGVSNKSATTAKGYTRLPGESPRGHYSYGVGGDYFTVLGHSLREGRYLTAADSRSTVRVCVVDEAFARRYWPEGSAIGQQVFQGPQERADAEAFRIVGVVGAVKQAALAEEDALGAVYYPFVHRLDRDIYVVTRTSLRPAVLGNTLRQAVRTIDSELPVTDIRSMDGRIADSLVARRSPALLAAAFSLMALLLAAIGTYGVLTYAVSERRREIGLRMALGARPDQVRRQFLSLALRLQVVATALGLFGAWFTGRAMQTILFQVPAIHVPTLAATAVTITVVSLVACLLPAHRAARISPTEVLNH
jgi:predicted permease